MKKLNLFQRFRVNKYCYGIGIIFFLNLDKFQFFIINLRNIDVDKKGSVFIIVNDEIMKIE